MDPGVLQGGLPVDHGLGLQKILKLALQIGKNWLPEVAVIDRVAEPGPNLLNFDFYNFDLITENIW